MKYLNNKFRDQNKTTDDLSFPFWNVDEYKKKANKEIYLGDIALNFEIIIKKLNIFLIYLVKV